MTNQSSNNKRIAKNTLLLYVRMLLTMAVSLYTSRIVLKALGINDYGIYNVVGGIVSMFTMLSGSLSAAISRFITFELGREDTSRLKNVFSTSVTIQFILAAIIIALAETVGLWFLNNKMVIPTDRLYAANWVYQLSLLTFVINLISVPYNAAIIAHERMKAFAYISIIEALGKLLVAYIIQISISDKLIVYAILLTSIAIIIRIVYGTYCKRNFEECSYHFVYEHSLMKQMFGFAGWNFIGTTSYVLRDQGGNIIINLFYGSAVNAARGIAVQVNQAISSFVTNFMTALNPQITKSYANGNHEYLMTLIFQGARFSFYLLLVLSLPVLTNTHYILNLWLDTVPEHTTTFVQLILIFTMSESLSSPLVTAQLATGNIRNYQIIVGGLQFLNLPISYVLLYCGCIPESVLIVAIFISQICLVARLIMLRKMINISPILYFRKVYINVVAVTLLAIILPAFISNIMKENLLSFILISLISLLSTTVMVLTVGCNKNEKKLLLSKIRTLINKIHD